MKLTNSQKLLLLSSVALFRHYYNVTPLAGEFTERNARVADWYAARTGITTETVPIAVKSRELVEEALLTMCEAVIEAEEAPEPPDNIIFHKRSS